MSRQKFKRIATALAVLSIPLLSGCGSSEPSNKPGVGGVPGATLPGMGAGGCVPITSQIPFTANNAYMAMRKIMAGQVPYSQAFGQVLVGGAATGGPYQGSGAYGTINMNIVPMGQPGVPTPGYPAPGYPNTGYPNAGFNLSMYQGQVTASGFIQVSPLAQQDIMNKVMMGQIQIPGYQSNPYGYPQVPTPGYPTPGYPAAPIPQQPAYNSQQICVSQIALSLNISSMNQLYIGDVYLYLNNTQHGFVLEF